MTPQPQGSSFDGVVQPSGALDVVSVPDSGIAVGTDYILETTNLEIRVYDKSTSSELARTRLDTFFGAPVDSLTDPRVIKDQATGRWIIEAIDNPFLGNSTQRLWIAVTNAITPLPLNPSPSWTTNAASPITVNYSTTAQFDFPILGINANALLLGGDITKADPVSGALVEDYGELLTFAKSTLYSGNFTVTKRWTNLPVGITPPIVLDQTATTFFVAAPPEGSSLALYAGQNLDDAATASLTPRPSVAVDPYVIPADAVQCHDPNAAHPLETKDSRFVSASTQRGTSLWQVHTTSYDQMNTTPTPRFYEIDTATNGVRQSGQFYRSDQSNDFNASIAANSSNDAFVTWTATEVSPSACANAEVRISGRNSTDPTGQIGTGWRIFGSASYILLGGFGTQDWGDFSTIVIDPSSYGSCAAGQRAWAVNERIPAQDSWVDRIVPLGFC